MPIALAAVCVLAPSVTASAHGHRHVHRLHADRVAASVTLDTPSGTLSTTTPIAFSGSVSPAGAGHRILLERQVGPRDRWVPVDGSFVHADGTYTIMHRFRRAGDRTLRTLLLPNRRTLRSASAPVTITVQQLQVEGFTIASSANPIEFGQSVTISGTLTGGASTSVTLFARAGHGLRSRLQPIATGMTDAAGAYAFTQTPARDTVYQVRVTGDPQRRTARLVQGIHRPVNPYALPAQYYRQGASSAAQATAVPSA
jgi:hypothetical protein